ncbi:hypothetical protein [Hymenobacter volaticus]|uniref:Outer membrane protein beta-barrel domain-containing protein n=1 Tax=Hymenobacter volaticus TaxID=2932254 RepID=A0ABY4G1Z1_9BACT|nr:hypothetical protein [Hymenobacter volaticus]UOQ64877.1 hypothetical protein MUN86_15040 [Hymenobacter volaticus]
MARIPAMMKVLFTCSLLCSVVFESNSQTFRAMAFNPNVYRTRVDMDVLRVSSLDFHIIYADTFKIKVRRGNASKSNYLDYKIEKMDENGYTIIRILPNVQLSTELLDVSNGKEVAARYINTIRHSKEDFTKEDERNGYNYYFAIKSDAFKPMSKTLLGNKLVAVPIIHPLKLRPRISNPDREPQVNTEFTVTYSLGYRRKFGHNPFRQDFFTFVIYGAGLGASKYLTEGNDGNLTEEKDGVAVTYYQAGGFLTLDKVNFGLFMGLDAMLYGRNNWLYQSKPWFSFGLGYKIKED